ncbi:hypothetical protein [Colwellia piezophila]|uniref:hypothetical protein n=1 Tax=Colwellia piezophila TaxID=211668 RepID=UPI00037AB424|nr:hypothetical protein [Colwellia piezophila]
MKSIKPTLLRHVIALLAILWQRSVYAAISMPKIFADNMVLQRLEPIKLWGWSAPLDKFSVYNSNNLPLFPFSYLLKNNEH